MTKIAFVDTNVVVYAHDARDLRKQRIAQDLLEDLSIQSQAVVSSQVVQEFCYVMLRGERPFMATTDLKTVLTEILFPLMNHTPDPSFYESALDLSNRYSLGYYDALIVQAAIDLGCDTLYSEDLQDGQKFAKLTVINPFKT